MLRGVLLRIKNLSRPTWILLLILVIGIFLRTYKFHDWLDFGSDQVNDANRVGAVVEGKAPWPSYGPDMGNSGAGGRENRFRLGPIYYDFEIISAKIFGNKPESMAYPDLLFALLSLPLFYIFIRKAFDKNISLALTGIFSVSFYALTFSHSAWNVNSIPFFSLLFALSLYEFIVNKEKTHWGWVVALGVALGVGVQLHAILLVLFPATLFFASVIYLRKSPKVWKKMAAVLLVMIALNLGQIMGEKQNDFKNSKIFLMSVFGSSTESKDSLAVRAAADLSCNFQANTFMLSAVGNSDCDFSLTSAMSGNANKRILSNMHAKTFILKAILCAIFSMLGYGLLVYYFRKEKDQQKKYFWGIMILYTVLSFFVMLPVIDAALRYFVHIFFLPFIFLGLAFDFMGKRFSKKYLFVAVPALVFLVVSNSLSIYSEVKNQFVDSRIVLGHVENMVDYMMEKSNNEKNIYILTAKKSDNYFNSLRYVANQRGVAILRAGDGDNPSSGKQVFYLGYTDNTYPTGTISGHNFDNQADFNGVTIYHLTN